MKTSMRVTVGALAGLLGACGNGGGGGPPGSVPFAGAFGVPGKNGTVWDVALMGDGSLRAVGWADCTIDFGAGPLASANSCGYLVAFAEDGAYDWSVAQAVTGSEAGVEAVAIDALGNAFIVGDFNQTMTIGPYSFTALIYGAFLALVSAQGEVLWAVPVEADSVGLNAAAARPDGGFVATGSFAGTLTVLGTSLVWAGSNDVFIIELNGDGSLRAARSYGAPSSQTGDAVAVDGENNVVLAGGLAGEVVDFGGGPLLATDDVFVAKFDAAGQHLWSRGFEGTGADILDAAVDGDGNILMVGRLGTDVDAGGGPIVGDEDGWIAKLDPDGNHLSSWSFPGAAFARLSSVAVAADGSIAVAGWFGESATLGGQTFTAAPGLEDTDALVAELGPDGDVRSARSFGGPDADWANGVALDGDRIAVVGGTAYEWMLDDWFLDGEMFVAVFAR